MKRDSRWTQAKPAAALVFGLLIASLPLIVDRAAAQAARTQSTYPAEVENQCKDDYFRYCSPYALGSDELRRCMEAKGKSLSSHCRQALSNAGYVKGDRARRGG